MTKEPKTERDERMAKEAQKSMPEGARAMRQNLEAHVKVTFGKQTEGPKSWALVHVTQTGSPHPKGIDAKIIDSRVESREGISRDMNQAICDDAVNFVRGQKTLFSCEEVKAPVKPEASTGENSSDGSETETTESAQSNQSQSEETTAPDAPAKDANGTVYEECSTEECKAAEANSSDKPAEQTV